MVKSLVINVVARAAEVEVIEGGMVSTVMTAAVSVCEKM